MHKQRKTKLLDSVVKIHYIIIPVCIIGLFRNQVLSLCHQWGGGGGGGGGGVF